MSVRVTREGRLQNLPARIDTGVRKGLHTAGMRVAGRARRIFTLFRPKGTATGATVRSITTSRVMRSFQYYHIDIGPGTPYAIYLHEKTPPQRPPPLHKILDWLKHKPGTRGQPDESLYGLAKTVQQKIAAQGTEAFPFMTVALKMEKNKVVEIVYKAIVQELSKP